MPQKLAETASRRSCDRPTEHRLLFSFNTNHPPTNKVLIFSFAASLWKRRKKELKCATFFLKENHYFCHPLSPQQLRCATSTAAKIKTCILLYKRPRQCHTPSLLLLQAIFSIKNIFWDAANLKHHLPNLHLNLTNFI